MHRSVIERVAAGALPFNFAQGAPSAAAIEARKAELSDAVLRVAARRDWAWGTLTSVCAIVCFVAAAAVIATLATREFGHLTLIALGTSSVTLLLGIKLAIPQSSFWAEAYAKLTSEKEGFDHIEAEDCPRLLAACTATPEGDRYREQVLAQHRQFVRAEYRLLTEWAAGARQREACAALYKTQEA